MERLGSSSGPYLEHHKEEEDEPSSNDKAIYLIKQINFTKWYSKVSIFINNFELKIVAASGKLSSTIQEGLILIKYYKKIQRNLRDCLR